MTDIEPEPGRADSKPGAREARGPGAPVVHARHKHESGHLHVTGEARYADDVRLPAGALHLTFGLSACARGAITELDLAPVRASTGVVDVLVAADIPGDNDVSPSVKGEPLLADGEVFYHGQPLFLVLAESHLAARRAARKAVVRFEEKPAVLTIDDAIAAESSYEAPIQFLRGEPEEALDGSPLQLEGTIEIGGQEHFYLEGQACWAIPGEDGEMMVHSSSQHPSEIQHKVAAALGEPYHKVRVEVRRMGGGFGGKESQGNALAVACALGARRTGRACKLRYDRDDDFAITGKRHPFKIRYRVGFDEEGGLRAVIFEHWSNCGWAQDLSLPVADRAMLHADNAYFLPHVRITSHRLRTNLCSFTAFRGFGGPQGMLGIERVMDHVAAHLGKDPAEIRRANLYGKESPRDVTPYHMKVEDNIAPELLADLAERSDYAQRRDAVRDFNDASPVIKRGIAMTPVKFGISFTLSHLNQAGALVHVYTDGSIHLNHGGTEMGQGLHTKVAQVAAQSFGQPLEAVRITATDTSKVPNTSATAASAGSDLNGMAVKAACDTIVGRLRTFAAGHWNVPEADVAFADGVVDVGGERHPFSDIVSLAYQARISLSSTGYYATPHISWDRKKGRGRPFFYFAYGAAVTEVAIDTLTGESRILRTDILHDVGRSLNPAIDIGQIEGGYVQGAGWLLTEELVWDDRGVLRTHAPSTYKIPCASDRPQDFRVELWDGANREPTIYRSKAVGEPPLMLGISAFLAIADAIAQVGDGSLYPNLDAPATPERVLRCVEAQRGRPW